MPYSIQLYTLRDLTAKDMPGTLRKVADIGYKTVELAGYGNLKKPQEVAGEISRLLAISD